jgi:hypothetical protein
MSEIKGWSTDPSGRHQERYFSDGQPTGLVRDVGHESYDSGQSLPAPSGPIGFAPPGANGNGSVGYAAPPTLPSPPAAYVEGWHPDPSGQLRYFANGQPTAWVSDGAQVREESAPMVLTPPDPQPRTLEIPDTPLQSNLGDPGPRGEQTARPAGWYRNASDPNDVRYWDGSDWIGQRSNGTDATNGPSVETNGAAAAPAPAPAPPEQPADRDGWQHDPFGRYKFRWFSSGEATSFVSDGDGKAFDESDRTRGQGPVGTEVRPGEGQVAGDSPSDPFAGLYSDPTEPAPPPSTETTPWTVQDGGQLNGASAGPAAEPHDDLVSKLERLAALRDSGALTHDEFGVAKQRLLSS